MFNNKNFNVSWITTFNDLHTFINFIFKKFDRFHDKSTPYNPPSNHQWGLVQLNSKLSSQHFVLSTPDRNAGIPDIYHPSIFLWNDMLKMFWNNINFQTSTASHSSTNHVNFQKHMYMYNKNNWVSIGRNFKTFPEKELLFPISSPLSFKRYIFEILPAFSHVSKHLISSIITLMVSCWGCQSYVSLTSAQEWCADSAPNLMKLWIDYFHSWYHLGWVEQT